ncbi:hypothetical protein EDD18DRAFT_1355239 [Armillaria luteobubalina]|uniref:Uncharacterized protein n=1 Tax=Armillaria luteobubalina TaxID=153913 RepID=A0AA39Q1G6_9AGAR|nr:hypothetical protein EDD18DRAFT_1355239 [Armillaria luteobubalina]
MTASLSVPTPLTASASTSTSASLFASTSSAPPIQPWQPPSNLPNPSGNTNSRRIEAARCHAPMPAFANPVATISRINIPRDGSVTAQQASTGTNGRRRPTNSSAFSALQNMASRHLSNGSRPARSGKTNRINGPVPDTITGHFSQKFLVLIIPVHQLYEPVAALLNCNDMRMDPWCPYPLPIQFSQLLTAAMPFTVLQLGKSTPSIGTQIKDSGLQHYGLSLSAFNRFAYHADLANPEDRTPILLLGTKYRLNGKLSDNQVHNCFAYHVLHDLQSPLHPNDSGSDRPDCHIDCPSAAAAETQENPPVIVDPSIPESSSSSTSSLLFLSSSSSLSIPDSTVSASSSVATWDAEYAASYHAQQLTPTGLALSLPPSPVIASSSLLMPSAAPSNILFVPSMSPPSPFTALVPVMPSPSTSLLEIPLTLPSMTPTTSYFLHRQPEPFPMPLPSPSLRASTITSAMMTATRRRSQRLSAAVSRNHHRDTSTDDPASVVDAYKWLEAIRDLVEKDDNGTGADIVALHISAVTEKAAAKALIACILHYHEDLPDFPPAPKDSDIHKFHYKHLLMGRCVWAIGHTGHNNQGTRYTAAIGSGPEKEVIGLAVEMLTAKTQFWCQVDPLNGLVSWAVHQSSSSTRLLEAKLMGTLAAVHLLWLKTTAFPISPSLYLAMIINSDDKILNKDTLSALNPHLSSQICQWPSYISLTPSHFTPTSALGQLFSSYISWASVTKFIHCSEEECLLFQSMPDMLSSAELKALRVGFNMDVIANKTFLSMFSDANVVSILSGLSASRIHTPDELIDHIVCTGDDSIPPDQITKFQTLIARYLRGKGHPSSLIQVDAEGNDSGLIPAQWGQHDDRQLYRTEQCLRMMTGSVLRPALDSSGSWTLSFNLVNSLPAHVISLDSDDDPTSRVQHTNFAFHVCGSSVDIVKSACLEELLEADMPSDVNVPTPFDEYIHRVLTEFEGAGSNYNVL